MKRASGFIIRDLEKQGAFDPVTAIDLPYTKQNLLRIGMRNYHAKAMEDMLSQGVVAKTGGGKYYLQARSSHEHAEGSGDMGSQRPT